MSDDKAEGKGSRSRRKSSLERKAAEQARWRVAAPSGGKAGAADADATIVESDYDRRRRVLSGKADAAARLLEHAYPFRNVAGEGARCRLAIDGDDVEGVMLAALVRLRAGQSSRELPPAFSQLLACDGEGSKRDWFNKLLEEEPAAVRVLRFVTHRKTLLLVWWKHGTSLPPSIRPRFLDTADDLIEEACGYEGELKDAFGKRRVVVVYGWFPHTDSDRFAWFGNGEVAAGGRPAPTAAPVAAPPPAKSIPKRERAKRKEVTIKGAALLCGVNERTIKNWEAGKGTPVGWPGRNNLQDLRHFGIKRGGIKAFAKASRKGLGAVSHTGMADRADDDPDED